MQRTQTLSPKKSDNITTTFPSNNLVDTPSEDWDMVSDFPTPSSETVESLSPRTVAQGNNESLSLQEFSSQEAQLGVTTESEQLETQALEPIITESAQLETQAAGSTTTESAQLEAQTLEPIITESAQLETQAIESTTTESAQLEPQTLEPIITESTQLETQAIASTTTESAQLEPQTLEPIITESAQLEPQPLESAASESMEVSQEHHYTITEFQPIPDIIMDPRLTETTSLQLGVDIDTLNLLTPDDVSSFNEKINQEKLATYREEIQKLSLLLKQKEEIILQLHQAKEKADEELAQSLIEKEKIGKELSQLLKDNEKVNTELVGERNTVLTAAQKIAALEKKHFQLQDMVWSYQEKVRDLEQRIETLHKEHYSQLKAMAIAYQKIAEDHEESENRLRTEKEELEKIIKQHTKTEELLRKRNSSAIDWLKVQNFKLDQAQEKNANLRKLNTAIKTHTYEQSLKDKETIHALEDTIKQQRVTLERIQQDKYKMEKDLEAKTILLQSTTAELEQNKIELHCTIETAQTANRLFEATLQKNQEFQQKQENTILTLTQELESLHKQKESLIKERDIALNELHLLKGDTEKVKTKPLDEINKEFAEKKETPPAPISLHKKENEHIQKSPPRPSYSAVAAGQVKLEKNTFFYKPAPQKKQMGTAKRDRERTCFGFLI
ncbi:MAG: hypothetical protein JO131_03700 [Gammaproteobacteria bacterium]|nr:hypothetical protein [Gammaproteobacteria bacterium]